MTGDRPAPWGQRIGPILRDLIAFDAAKLDVLLATRTMLGLFLPLLGAELFGWRDLSVVGIGAFLVCIGDCVEDGDKGQATRLLAGIVLGSLAFGSGALLGANLLAALAGMMVWGLVCGLMGLWGPAYAAMSMPVVWAYVELGLPAPDHGLGVAATAAALFAAGGGFAAALTFAFARLFPLRQQQRLTADCYRALALYVCRADRRGHISGETQVRAAIAQARQAARRARASGPTERKDLERLARLVETADRLFSLASVARETNRIAAAGLRADFLTLTHRIRSTRASKEPPASTVPTVGVFGDIRHELAGAHAIIDGPLPEHDPRSFAAADSNRPALRFLRENLTLRSVAMRHALRFAAVMSVAVLVFWFLPKPFGFWVPLTVTVVLKPFAGMTMGRAVQRVAGTLGGILLAMAVMPLLTTVLLKTAFVFTAFFLMMMVLPFNYSLAVFLLSAGIVPYEHLLNPDLNLDVATFRLLATLAGAALALVGGHLLWPDFEHQALPALLGRTRRAMSAYARAVLRGDAPAIPDAHSITGLEVTNLQTALQRALTEIGGDQTALHRMASDSAALQRLFIALNAIRLAPDLPVPEGFPGAFASALAEPEIGRAAHCRSLLGAAPSAPLLAGLCADLARLEPASPQDASRPPAAAHPVAKDACNR